MFGHISKHTREPRLIGCFAATRKPIFSPKQTLVDPILRSDDSSRGLAVLRCQNRFCSHSWLGFLAASVAHSTRWGTPEPRMNAEKHPSSPPASPRPSKQQCAALRGEFTVKQGSDIAWSCGGVLAKVAHTGSGYGVFVCGIPSSRHAHLAETPLRV